MTTSFFYQNYNNNDINIIDFKIIDNNLYLKLEFNTYIELIANGYRPELDLDIKKTFIFKNIKYNIKPQEKYILNDIFYDNHLHLIINNCDIEVLSNDIDIIE